MRILAAYTYLSLGGVESVFRARMDGFRSLGIEFRAWFLFDRGGRPMFTGHEANIEVGGIDALARHVREERYDLLLNIDTPAVQPAFAAAVGRPPIGVEFHTPYVENQAYLAQLGPAPPQGVLVPSVYQRCIARRLLAGDARTTSVPVEVIPNPLRLDFAAPLRTPTALPPVPPVAWIGRLDDLKNWRGFLALGAALAGAGMAHELWLAGKPIDPETGRAVVDTARWFGVLPQLRWYRGLPHERMPAFLDLVRAGGGVLTSTSRGESFGMTVAEAMARGCAVAVPDTPPFDEFVTDATGVRFATDPAAAAAEAVVALLADARRRDRLGAAARDAILARHAPAHALPTLAEAYRALAGR